MSSQVALAIWLVLAASAIAITWLWWHGGNVSAVRTFGDGMTGAGRLTGLLAAYSAPVQPVQVLTSAGVPSA